MTDDRECTRYFFVFFPIATYTRVGDVSLLTIFGIPVYKKVGDLKAIFNIVYK